MLYRLFTQHPASVGETYFQHLCSAWSFAGHMLLGAAACLVHGLFPWLFETTGSGRVARLHDRMLVNRSRLARQTREADRFAAHKLSGGAS